MTALEIEARNVAKAVKKACAQLNVSDNELRYDILSHGASGIFGLAGVKKARILVHVPEADAAAKVPEVPTDAADADGGDLSVSMPEGEIVDVPVPYDSPTDPADMGLTVLQRIVDSISADAEISIEAGAERIQYNVTGGNPAVLIGKKGQTLEAIQILVDKIVNRRNNNHDRIRVRVDVEGYLETRKKNLKKLAERMADKSNRIGKPVSLGQMSAYDRRIVHMTLKDHPDVRTKSRGEGHMRKLVIFPRKKSSPSARQQLN
jgi:spoIIIJ-associated protein